jgi:GT2 family glycosyltransferase
MLVESALFDVEWYAVAVGRTFPDKLSAVRHYVERPVARRVDPHPLFDRDHFSSRSDPPLASGRDPFVVYLRRRLWERATHPLFDTVNYLAAHPEAGSHPWGPLGHYQEIGAVAGFAPNSWFVRNDETGSSELMSWLRDRQQEWRARTATRTRRWVREIPRSRVRAFERNHPESDAPALEETSLSIVVTSGVRPESLAETLASIQLPTEVMVETVLLDEGLLPGAEHIVLSTLPRARVITVPAPSAARGHNAALEAASGRFVTFLCAGDTWVEGRLGRLLGALADGAARAGYDALSVTDAQGETRIAFRELCGGLALTHNDVDLSRIIVDRGLAAELGFDESLAGAWDFDFVARLFEACTPLQVPAVGVRRDLNAAEEAHRRAPADTSPRASDHADTWRQVVARQRLVDWDGLARTAGVSNCLSVVIPTHGDAASTEVAVAAVAEEAARSSVDIECIVWDNGSSASVAIALDALPLKFSGVRVRHSPVDHHLALGCDLALGESTGEYVLFLNHGTTLLPGWADPLVTALADPNVLGAQPLVLSADGTIESAGVAFPGCGGIPAPFLSGFPEEDAECTSTLRFSALSGAALAVRRNDVVAMRGFDPLFRGALAGVDLCLRLAESREGHFVVVPSARVLRQRKAASVRDQHEVQDRGLFLERWQERAPRDDVELWAAAGYTVVDHEIPAVERPHAEMSAPAPVLVRTPRLRATLAVTEAPPSLRWCIKNPAPAGEQGDKWGDTHFADAIAGALRRRGQEVLIDRRDSWERASGRHDDVNLVLRGLSAFHPSPENVSILWVISHPDLVQPAEAVHFDRVLAASMTWGVEQGPKWGIRIDPLLQATDPERFNPDLGVPDTGEPVLFVGGSRKTHRPVVMAAVEQGLPVSIYGFDWEGLVPPSLVKAAYLPNDQVGAAYRNAGLVLNDHWEDMRVAGFVSNRLFDAVAAGARVISDDVAGVKELFGDSVQVMRDPGDLVRLSSLPDPDSVFGDDRARRETAARVAREHSFDARAAQLLDIAAGARRSRGFGA